MQKFFLTFIVSAIVIGGLAQPAVAIKQFSDGFMKLYKIDKRSKEKSDFEKTMIGAKCYLCHQGKKKKHHNRYGEELEKLLDKKKDKKDKAKITEALEKVAKMHIDSKDPKSPTYGELIKAGKLPGGPLADAKKEPAGHDSHGEDSDSHEAGHAEADTDKKESSDKK